MSTFTHSHTNIHTLMAEDPTLSSGATHTHTHTQSHQEQCGFQCCPWTLVCRVEEPGIEQPTTGSVDNLLSLLSLSPRSTVGSRMFSLHDECTRAEVQVCNTLSSLCYLQPLPSSRFHPSFHLQGNDGNHVTPNLRPGLSHFSCQQAAEQHI